MKNISYKKALQVLAFSGLVILCLSNSFNPPNGYTSAPGTNDCSSCHTQENVMQMGTFDIQGVPAYLAPGESFNFDLVLTNTNSTSARGGYQATIVDPSGNFIGDLEPGNGLSVVQSENGVEYAENFEPYFIGEQTFNIQWTAPQTSTNLLATIYASSVIGGFAGDDDFDLVLNLSKEVTVAVPPVVIFDNIEFPTCFGDQNGSIEVAISEGIPPYTIEWSTGDTGDNPLTGLGAGGYGVTVTDVQGNSSTAGVVLHEPAELELTIMTTDATQVGGMDGTADPEVNGGTEPYQYEWIDGSTEEERSDLSAGVYSLTVTDFNGCSEIITFEIGEPSCSLDLLATSSDLSCNGDMSGSILLEVFVENEPYEVVWSNGQTGDELTGLAGGFYSYTITDAAGCVHTGDISIFEPSEIMINSSVVNASGQNNDGSIHIDVQGGVQPYTYNWTGPNGFNATTKDISGLAAGNYLLVITDDNGCTITFEEITVELESAVHDLRAYGVEVYPNPAQHTLYIRTNSNYRAQSLTILSADGRAVLEVDDIQADSKRSIGISTLPRGVYFLRLIQNNEVSVQQLVIQ